MRGSILLVAVAMTGCHVTASGGGDTGGSGRDGVDAADPADGDPGGSGSGDAPPAPACANGRTIFLDFEGTTLTAGMPSDATRQIASWMTASPATIPAWNAGSQNRAAEIAAVTAGVKAQLSATTGFPGPIAVTTTAPVAGPYIMIVYGGTAAQSHSSYAAAVNTLDCADSAKSDVAWIHDFPEPVNTTAVINTTLGAIGFGLGLTSTNDPTDCMCSWANGCTKDQTQICTLHDGITRDPGQGNGGTATQICAGAAPTQDEHAVFATAFCQ